MPVDLAVCQKRLTALFNANAKNADGSMIYSTAVSDDRRHATEISDLVDEGAMAVLLAIAESPSNGFRNVLMADSAEIPHRGRIPQHIGPIGVVKIQRFDGDSFWAGAKRPANEIESMRENINNFYAVTAHDQQDGEGHPSPISGFWDILADELFYTGFSAKMQIANFTLADAATKVPDPYRDAVISHGFFLGVKDGDISLTARGAQLLNYATEVMHVIRAGASAIPPIPEAQSKGA